MFHKFGALMHLNLKVFESKKGNKTIHSYYFLIRKNQTKKTVSKKKSKNIQSARVNLI